MDVMASEMMDRSLRRPGYRALVVDDEAALAEVVASYLEREQFEALVIGDGAEAVVVAREFDPDVVILDLGLPGMDGLEVCRQLHTFSDAYVVMLTARDTEMDTIVGLTVGADDYVTKPFSMDELLARIRVLTRRIGQDEVDEEPVVAFGSVWVDLAAHTVTRDGANVRLTPTEWRVLELLIRNEGRLVTRQTMLSQVWGSEHVTDTGYLRLYISQLRKKLEPEPSRPRYLITDAGMGYRLVLDP